MLLLAPLQASAQDKWCDVRGTFQADGDLIDLEPVLADDMLYCNPDNAPSASLTDDEDGPRPDWVDDWGRLDDDWPAPGSSIPPGYPIGSSPPTPCLNPSALGFPPDQLGGALVYDGPVIEDNPPGDNTDGTIPLDSCGWVAGPEDCDAGAPGCSAGEQGDVGLDGHTGGNAIRHVYVRDPDTATWAPGNLDNLFTQGSKIVQDICEWTATRSSVTGKSDIESMAAAFNVIRNTDPWEGAGETDYRDDTYLAFLITTKVPNGSNKVGAWLLRSDIVEIETGSTIVFRPASMGLTAADIGTAADPCNAAYPGGPIQLHVDGDIFIQLNFIQGGVVVLPKVSVWDTSANGGAGGLVVVVPEGESNCQLVADGSNPFDRFVCATSNAFADVVDPKDAPGDIAGIATHMFFAPSKSNFSLTQKAVRDQSLPGAPEWLKNDIQGDENKEFPPYDQPGNTVYESVLNLSAFTEGLGCFSTFMGMTDVSGSSPNPQAKDYALGNLPLCGLVVTKTGDTLAKVGDPVHYTITIENTGAITLYLQSIVDTLLGDLADALNGYITSSTCGVAATALAPGDSCTIELTRTVLDTDPNPLPNTVTATYNTADDGTSGDSISSEDDHSVDLFTPGVTISKTCDDLVKVGDDIDCEVEVTNTSDANTPPMTCVVTDSQTGEEFNGLLTGTETLNYSYPAPTEGGGTTGNHVEVLCSIEGFPNQPFAEDDYDTDYFDPSVTIDKTGDTLVKAGDDIDYTITITNTSSINTPALTCVATDSLKGEVFNGVLTDPETINYTYTAPASGGGTVSNTVSVVCSIDGFTNTVGDSDGHSTDYFEPSITVDKTGDTLVKAGDDIDYSVTITNTSSINTPALSCVATDSLKGEIFNGALGGGTTVDYTYPAPATGGGTVNNTVDVVCSIAGEFTNTVGGSDGHSTDYFDPSISVTKTGDTLVKAGDDIDYEVTISNTSSANTPALTCVATDNPIGVIYSGALGAEPVVVNYSAPAPASGGGTVNNTVDVLCDIDGFTNQVRDSDGHSTNYFEPSVTVDKTGDELVKAGDDIDYTITITNTSSINTPALTCVATDSQEGVVFNGVLTDPEVVNYSYPAPATGGGTVNNTVDVLCDIAGGFTNQVGDSDGHSTDYFEPSITVDKSGDTLVKAGDDIDYTVIIANTSSINTPALTCVATDSQTGVIFNGLLGTGTTENYSYPAPATGGGTVNNTVNVLCSIAGFTNTVGGSDGHSTDYFEPSISVDKTGDTLVKAGDDIDYTVTINNTSSINTPALTCVATDSQTGEIFNGVLGSGTTENYSYPAPATGGGTVNNTVDVLCSIAGFTNTVGGSDGHSTDFFEPSISVDKTGDLLVKAGDDIDYTVTISNTSSINTPALTCVATDSQTGEIFNGVLGSGTTENYSYPAPATGGGTVNNTVDVLCSIAGFTNTVGGSDGHSTDFFEPIIAVDKTGDLYSKVGDTVNYTITLSNNSSVNTPDLDCEANDTLLGLVFDGVLPAGDTVLTPSRTVLPGDSDPLPNTVTLTCSPVGFPNVLQESDDHEVDLINPSFSVAKTCDFEPIDFDVPADFTVTIANTGDVPLIVNADDGIGTFDLAVGETRNFPVSVPGPHTPGGTADNTVTATWALPGEYGLPNTGEASASDSCDVLDVEYHTAYGMGLDNTCFDELGANNWGWVNGNGLTSIVPGTYVWPVWAGAAQCDTSKGTYVGTVEVDYDGTDVNVTWHIDPPHVLGDTHVYAGHDLVPPGGFSPGQYEIYSPFAGEPIYIIVHAIVGVAQ